MDKSKEGSLLSIISWVTMGGLEKRASSLSLQLAKMSLAEVELE